MLEMLENLVRLIPGLRRRMSAAETDIATLKGLFTEGTFTPTLKGTASDPTLTGTVTGTYKKIGKMVYVQIVISGKITAPGSGDAYISGLPFAGDGARNYLDAPHFWDAAFWIGNPNTGLVTGSDVYIKTGTNNLATQWKATGSALSACIEGWYMTT